MKNANTLAMPGEAEVSNKGELWAFQVGTNSKFKFPGLTKREIFAMNFHAAILSRNGQISTKDLASKAVEHADALLAELDK